MASIQPRVKLDKVTWRVHYRIPGGSQRNRTFAIRSDAVRFVAFLEANSLNLVTQTSPATGATVGEWAATWLAGQVHLKASTRERYAGIVRSHIVPTWGPVPLERVTHAGVQAWVTSLAETRSPATVRKVFRVLSLILGLAVRDGQLRRNVARGINLPRPVRHEQRFLTIPQVEALAKECGHPSWNSRHRPLVDRHYEPYRLAVLFLAFTGVRFGELAALRVGRLDPQRRRALIIESVTQVQGHGMVWGTPKMHARREVPIPRFLAIELAAHIEGKDPGELVFTGVRSGGPIRVSTFRRGHFDAAAQAIGVPGLHPHELRHTAASLAIANGADVKVLQQMLGHASAAMTLDVYGHLFDGRLDEVADALERARNRAASEIESVAAAAHAAGMESNPGTWLRRTPAIT
ncbi:site-specific integrase [Nocardioides agariphilus]|uniref:Site-specific integrase n=1 Tax=Nocardioides agariphilus TaxID=433664 RepID=A0A930VKX1_9ACTN|nr:site-specific integrase [Nocardioides agariphilus]MBF4766610.1 site-specific integrase [Nocardioides agariphilus]